MGLPKAMACGILGVGNRKIGRRGRHQVKKRKERMCALLILVLLVCTSCQKQTEPGYFQPLLDFLQSRGYTGELEPLKKGESPIPVPIYDETVWHLLWIGQEEVLVYFDSSNRAKHLAEQFCSDVENGKVIYVGLRFILCYPGTDEEISLLMDEWQKEYDV